MAIPENALFLRAHELVIGPKVSTIGTPTEPVIARRFANRLNFRVEKSTVPAPNKAKITLYNISKDSRNFLEQKDMIVFLKAGFNNDPKNIFIGEILRRESGRSGPDVTLSLECGDAERILTRAHIEISLRRGATNLLLFSQAAAKLGLSLGISSGITQVTYRNGYAFSGLVSDLLTEQTRNLGLEWNIQDGELRILPIRGTDGETAVVIDKDSGLIGFPTKTIDGLKFDSLLNHRLRPGRAVKVASEQFQGQFGPTASLLASTSLIQSGDITKCRRVIHEGDTREGKWTSSVESVIPRSGAI